MKGKFICIEGFDGCGKSTLISKIKQHYDDDVWVFIREPGTTIAGEKIRNILLHENCNLLKESEILLFFTSFIETSVKVIKPALDAGKLVFADRWFFSTEAYQEYAHQLKNRITNDLCIILNRQIAIPDFTIILDIPFEVALQRTANKSKDNFESRDIEYLKRVHEYYANFTAKCTRIDATMSIDEVFNKFDSCLKHFLWSQNET